MSVYTIYSTAACSLVYFAPQAVSELPRRTSVAVSLSGSRPSCVVDGLGWEGWINRDRRAIVAMISLLFVISGQPCT